MNKISEFFNKSEPEKTKQVLPSVLLVDDDETHRNVLAFDFKRKGFNVIHATGGNDAWNIILDGNIHLVVTDIQMPNGNGIDLLSRIKRRDPKFPPVILITGYTELNLADAKDWGAEAAFTKPLSRKKLLSFSEAIIASLGFNCK